jgi:hypothetical protein
MKPSGTSKVAWLLFKNQGKNKDLTGVQIHTQSYDPKAPLLVGDELLDDGGIGLNLSAKEVLVGKEKEPIDK